MAIISDLEELTDFQLLKRQKSLGLAINRATESSSQTRGLEVYRLRRQLWKIMDEQDRRKEGIRFLKPART